MKRLLALLFLICLPVIAQTNLGLGDIAFTGYQSESGDRFAFVLLKDIETGTEIVFTDKGWKLSGGFYEPEDEPENTITWVSTVSLTYGTQILIQTIELSDGTKVLASSHGNVDGDTFGLSDSGDQIFAYQGSRPTSGDQSNFLSAIQMNGEWNEDATSGKKSSKPTIFTDGVNSLYIIDPIDGSEIDNAVYNCSVKSSNANILRTAVNNPSNWIKSDSFNNDPISIPYCSEPLPVELVTFTAKANKDYVELNWETATELNNFGFEVEKQKIELDNQKNEWKKVGFVPGNGNSNSNKIYSFKDYSVTYDNYLYRLKQIDIDGSVEYSNVTEINLGLPNSTELFQNYPNPFNPITKIKYQISEKSIVRLTVYNSLGEVIIKLKNEEQFPNIYEVEFDASALPSGLYFYHLETERFLQTKKMILLK